MDYQRWKEYVNEGRAISYSDVRQEYDAILNFLKKDILQKQGSKYVADALEMLANDVRDGLHNPDPYDKENYAYFDRDSGTQPNLKEDDLDEKCQKGYKTHPTQKTKEMYGKTYRNCIKADEGEERVDESAMIDLATLDYLWKNLKVPGVIGDFFDGGGINDKIDDWFKNNMGNPLVRGLYKSMMLMGSPPDKYRHDKNWEKQRGK